MGITDTGATAKGSMFDVIKKQAQSFATAMEKITDKRHV